MTQLQKAKQKILTSQVKEVAEKESIKPINLRNGIEKGTIVIPANIKHKNLNPIGIGEGLSTKVNANIGTSIDYPQKQREVEKAKVAVKYGADTLMDLSTGGDIDSIRKSIIKQTTVPIGTVPIYQVAIEAIKKRGSIVNMKIEDILDVIKKQAEDGVDFMTIHSGITSGVVERLKNQKRVIEIVSRGGSFLFAWILHNNRENPLYEYFDEILDIAVEYDITISLGDALRPGAISDATDRPQIDELIILGELVERCREKGVQVMVEGPGHVPLDQIVSNVEIEKRVTKKAPFYVLGPLTTDIAPGYDHIVGAIGGAIAASVGTDFLCYITPSEHIGLPGKEEVKEGVIASKIAAHSGDIVKGVGKTDKWDYMMSQARKALDWEKQRKLALNPEKFDKLRKKYSTKTKNCSMCGDFCALKIVDDYFGNRKNVYKKKL